MARTDTHVDWHRSLATPECIAFSGILNIQDLAKLRLDRLDRAVVFSPIESAADLFQTLEIIFRRMAEQAPQEPK